MAEVSIRATLNGPFIVKGATELLDTVEDKYPINKETIALCRCGQSSNKPFCDGTHSKIGFQASERVADRKRE
jgi:CDGSH-type Zn-finger protein